MLISIETSLNVSKRKGCRAAFAYRSYNGTLQCLACLELYVCPVFSRMFNKH